MKKSYPLDWCEWGTRDWKYLEQHWFHTRHASKTSR